jgi:hypothetical protein
MLPQAVGSVVIEPPLVPVATVRSKLPVRLL